MTVQDDAVQPIAVFDFGKTNAKMFVFGPDLTILYEERCTPVWRQHGDYRVLDDEHLWAWLQAALRRSREVAPAAGIMITTHGCTGALLAGGRLAHPILDYESEPPADVAAAFSELVPQYLETLSPALDACMNLGKQIYWIERTDPEVLAKTETIVPYPQFWGCKLGASPLSEVTSLGSHTHLWSPLRSDFSSLVYSQGWRSKFPAFAGAGAVVGSFTLDGTSMRIHNGVHDSNAALYLYRRLGEHPDCTLVSTGTWVIVFNPACPRSALHARLDMLANIDVDGLPVPTGRFMGGREFDVISRNARMPVTQTMIERVIQRGQFALPAFAQGGPFSKHLGCLIGPAPESDEELAAIATLYLACMTATVLDHLRSSGTIILDGGLASNAAYPGLLAALRTGQTVLRGTSNQGTAAGAAAIAFNALGHRPPPVRCDAVPLMSANGLAQYAKRWRQLSDARSC